MKKTKMSSSQKFNSGTLIFKEGDEGDCAFIIEKGRVQITVMRAGIDTPINILGPGDIFGEFSLIDGLPRSASAWALDDVDITTVTREQINGRIETLDPVVRMLISVLLKRMRNATKSYQGQSDTTVAPSPVASMLEVEASSKEALERIHFEMDLKEAFDKREFELHYQPIINLESTELKGFEALIRWNSPKRGRVAPDVMMNIAEDTSLIIPMGYWIIEQAFIDLKRIQLETGLPDLFMSINVSVRQFASATFPHELEAIRYKHDIQAEQIKLEATERILAEGPVARSSMETCRELGYQLSLDDFGTGYSSLTYLAQMNFDVIKVDRTFVSQLEKDPKALAIIEAIIAMAKGLNTSLVAEGIETHHEWMKLRSLGVLLGQGYLFGKPVPVLENIKNIKANKKVA